MKGYILDSDTWIEYFRHRGGVDKHIAETPAEEIFASEVSIAELTFSSIPFPYSSSSGSSPLLWKSM